MKGRLHRLYSHIYSSVLHLYLLCHHLITIHLLLQHYLFVLSYKISLETLKCNSSLCEGLFSGLENPVIAPQSSKKYAFLKILLELLQRNQAARPYEDSGNFFRRSTKIRNYLQPMFNANYLEELVAKRGISCANKKVTFS